MSTQPEPEILAALAQAGLRARASTCISNIRAPEIDRTAWRIELSDRTIKARRLESEAAARDLYGIRRELPDAFAPVLFQHGRVLVEEWIDGEVLAHPSASRLAEAGALLADLHRRSDLGGVPLHDVRATEDHRTRAEDGLRQLVAAGALAEAEAARLVRAMRQLDPDQAMNGVIHFDFCGENMVIDRQGRLRVVDNERVHVGALGFDLARTWYRWALPPAGWDEFHSTYAAGAPLVEPPRVLRFWRIVAVARAAALRLRTVPERAGAPLGLLRLLATEEAP